MNVLKPQPLTDDCEAISELIADYAFGLTDPDATILVESNLARCTAAKQELADFRRIQDALRAEIAPVTPPPALRAALLSKSALTPKTKSVQTQLRIHPAWWAAAAAFALLIVTNVYWFSRANTLDNGNDVVQTNPNTSAFILNSTSGLRWVRLPAAQETMTAAAFLMWNADSQIGLMYAVNMPELLPGRVYELWLNRDGERTSVGSFVVDDAGEAALLFSSADPIDEFAWAWITEEPATGSPQPSDNIIARGEL